MLVPGPLIATGTIPQPTARLITIPTYHPDLVYGGNGFIAGSLPENDLDGRVTKQGEPTVARVTAFHRRVMRVVAETWSEPDGTYRLENLDPAQDYVVIAWDHTGEYNAVIRDRVRPAPYIEE